MKTENPPEADRIHYLVEQYFQNGHDFGRTGHSLNKSLVSLRNDYDEISENVSALCDAISAKAAEIDRLRGVIETGERLVRQGLFLKAADHLRAALAEGNGQEGGV